MERLQQELDRLVATLPNAEAFRASLDTLISMYPFNDYEYVIAALLAADKLTHDEYIELRDADIAGTCLYTSNSVPRAALGKRGRRVTSRKSVPGTSEAIKKMDPSYSGEYDFLLDGRIKIEVKASVLSISTVTPHSTSRLWLPIRNAIRHELPTSEAGVLRRVCLDWCWRDVIRYWVLASKEMASNRYYSTGQRRGNTGEGQLHLKDDNIREFSAYEAKSNGLADALRKAYDRQTKG